MTKFKNMLYELMSENILKISDKIHDLSIYDLIVIPNIQGSEKRESNIKLKDNYFYFSQSHS